MDQKQDIGAEGGQITDEQLEAWAGRADPDSIGMFDVENSAAQALREVADEVERIERAAPSSADVEVWVNAKSYGIEIVGDMPGQD
jgi:hypothetical protein